MANMKDKKDKMGKLVKPPTTKMGKATKSKKYNDSNKPFIKGETAGMTKGQVRRTLIGLKAKDMERKDVRSATAKRGVSNNPAKKAQAAKKGLAKMGAAYARYEKKLAKKK